MLGRKLKGAIEAYNVEYSSDLTFETVKNSTNLLRWVSTESPGISVATFEYGEAVNLQKRAEEEMNMILKEISLFSDVLNEMRKKNREALIRIPFASPEFFQKYKRYHEVENAINDLNNLRDKVNRDTDIDLMDLNECLDEIEEKESISTSSSELTEF